MGNIHLVTGFAGHQHITSADQAVFNSLMFGGGQYVLAKGNQFAASIVTNNQINVRDGDILMQGRHIRLNEATSVDLTIENGTQGYSRNDLIVVRYTKDENTGIEDANLVVIKGTAAAGNPADPPYTSGDLINDNAILNDMPLYRVQLDGLNISAIIPLFDAVEINLITHASHHASGGSDPITPEMIDAAKAIHASQHGSNGVDQITPEMIDAFAVNKSYYTGNIDDITNGSYLVLPNATGDMPWTDRWFDLIAFPSGTGGCSHYAMCATESGVPPELKIRHCGDSGWSRWSTVASTDYAVKKTGDHMTGVLTVETSGKAAINKLRTYNGVQYKSSLGVGVTSDGDAYGILDIQDVTNNGNLYGIAVSCVKKKPFFYEYTAGGTLDAKDLLHTGNMSSAGFTHIASGEYVGTGTYGTTNHNEVVVDFTPKIMFIVAHEAIESSVGFSAGSFAYCSDPLFCGDLRNSGGVYVRTYNVADSSDINLRWFAESAKAQFNESGKIYHYVILG